MASTNEHSQVTISLDEIIKNALSDIGETSDHLYVRAKGAAIRGLRELKYDVLNQFKEKYLPVNSATKTAKLPNDYVNRLRVGVITQGNEIQDLALDENLVHLPITEEGCDPVTSHCSCGCTDPLCAAISNATTTTETITINGTDYTKTTTVCTNEAGTITGRICEPVVTNPTKTCNYSITFPRTLSELTDNPYTNFYFTKNSQQLFIGDIEGTVQLTSIMTANGFSVTATSVTEITYGITATPNVWTTATFTNDDLEAITIEFSQTSCVQPTPTVETICYDTIICEAPETLPCGCPVLNDEIVNTIQQWSTLFMEFIQRDLHGMDWQKTLKQPLSWFGYYKIYPELGIIQLDEHFPFDTVYLKYYTTDDIDGGSYQVPILAQEALSGYIVFKMTWNKTNVPYHEKKKNQKYWLNEKKKLHERNTPLNLADVNDRVRQFPRP